MIIKFKRLHKNAVIPKQASEGAGGWDVVATHITIIPSCAICELGFAVEIPKGYKLTIVPRSSLTKSYWTILNSPCLIDSDYRGQIMVIFRAIPNDSIYTDFPYKVGDRIAQCYLEEVIPMEFEEVDELSNTDRGSGGFGSTNK